MILIWFIMIWYCCCDVECFMPNWWSPHDEFTKIDGEAKGSQAWNPNDDRLFLFFFIFTWHDIWDFNYSSSNPLSALHESSGTSKYQYNSNKYQYNSIILHQNLSGSKFNYFDNNIEGPIESWEVGFASCTKVWIRMLKKLVVKNIMEWCIQGNWHMSMTLFYFIIIFLSVF